MAALFKDFKKMIDISEEAELAAEERRAAREQQGRASASPTPLQLDTHELDAIAKRAEAAVQKKSTEYTSLLAETQHLRAEYDVFKTRSDMEIKTLKRSVTELQQASQDLKAAASATGRVDEVYTSGLERQVESLKERDRKHEAEILRLEKRCRTAELGKELVQAQRSADLTAMGARLEAWRGVVEAKLQKAAVRAGGDAGTADAPESSLDDMARLQEEVEKTVADNMELRQAADALRKEAEQLAAQLLDKDSSLERARGGFEDETAQLKLTIASLEGTIASMATQQEEMQHAAPDAGLGGAHSPGPDAGGDTVPTISDQQYQIKAREVLDLKQKNDNLAAKAALLGTQLEAEKECVRNVMQLLDDTREENRRKEDALGELFNENEDTRARLLSLESMAASSARALQAKDEEIEQSSSERAVLEQRLDGLAHDLEVARAAQRESEQKVAQLERGERLQLQRMGEVEFELEQARRALHGREGDERRNQEIITGKDEETTQLRARLADAERRLHEALKASREARIEDGVVGGKAALRRSVSAAPAAHLRTSTPRAQRAGGDVESPGTAGAARSTPVPARITIGSMTFTRNTLIFLAGMVLLLGMYGAYSSVGMLSPEFEAQQQELASCKEHLIKCSLGKEG